MDTVEGIPITHVEVDGKELLLAVPSAKDTLALPIKMNRQQRREMERNSSGKHGKKSKRMRPVRTAAIAEDEFPPPAPEIDDSMEKTISAAQGLRMATRGAFWLPGDPER